MPQRVSSFVVAIATFASLCGAAMIADPRRELSVGLTAAELREKAAQLKKKGYRPVILNGCVKDESIRYSAIWEQRSGVAWEMRLELDADRLQKEFDQLTANGYTPIYMHGCSVGGKATYCELFEKRRPTAAVSLGELTAQAFEKKNAELKAQGFRLLVVNAMPRENSVRYWAIWEKRDGPDWQVLVGLNADALQREFDRITGEGYQPVHVSGCVVEDEVYYTEIFEQRKSTGCIARVGLAEQELTRQNRDLTAKGYRPITVMGCSVKGEVSYAAIWEK